MNENKKNNKPSWNQRMQLFVLAINEKAKETYYKLVLKKDKLFVSQFLKDFVNLLFWIAVFSPIPTIEISP